jgi:hypothetical protein
MVAGVSSNSISGVSDSATVSFGATFASAPAVLLSVEIGSNLDVVPNLQGVSTTNFSYRIAQMDQASVSGAYDLHWLAIGTLA